ncbi:MAG: sulfite exporter TauE/SafE family protein [Parvularculaceae bacterium]
MDFTLYWFMLPVSVLVATTAMLSGIGGAALFTPIFIIIFPLLGPEYPLTSTVAAIGTALLTETFGFSSGFIGYYRKRLVDFSIVWKFLRVSVPVAVFGALFAHYVSDWVLIIGYALLVLALAFVLEFFHHSDMTSSFDELDENGAPGRKTLVDRSGRAHAYRPPKFGPISGLITGTGAFLTGMVSVGMGEVVVPQLTKRGVPVAVAAATSVAVVIVTVASASFTQISKLIAEGGLSAVPWNLVAYTIPGVIIGGQLGPRLQGMISHRFMERAIGGLFLVIAVSMAYVGALKAGWL